MNRSPGLTQNDSGSIGFVVACLFAGAIDISEMREWCTKLVRARDSTELPLYVFDLLDFSGPIADVYGLIGFIPSSGLRSDQKKALSGIARLRGAIRDEWPVSRENALAALARHPELAERFRTMFEIEIPGA